LPLNLSRDLSTNYCSVSFWALVPGTEIGDGK